MDGSSVALISLPRGPCCRGTPMRLTCPRRHSPDSQHDRLRPSARPANRELAGLTHASTSFWHAFACGNDDRIFDRCRGHAFLPLQQMPPMIETVPLAPKAFGAAEAYGRMMRNEARFRIVLVTGTKPHHAHEFQPPV